MARGWESKSVEAQQSIDSQRAKPSAPLSAGQRASLERRRSLQLARARTVADLKSCRSEVHREMLEQALQAIDDQIRRLD